MRHQVALSFPYGNIAGALALREQIAKLVTNSGCVLHPDDLLITSGCQEALSVCLRLVTEPGDIVAVEFPSFYELAQSYDICIIEDDIYGDISYQSPRPKTIKSFDEDGRVLLCRSFSKSVAPGIHIGSVAPGRYRDKVMHVKHVSSSMCPTLPQLAIADFIQSGGYNRHTRKVRLLYKQGRDHLIKCIKHYFPKDTRISFPQGAYVLWVELNKQYDAVKLAFQCQEGKVSIAPGTLFSATGKYRHCMRLNFSEKTQGEREQGIHQLAAYINQQ
jgi:DNA-binding transcriptional MocR family regulator